MKFALIDPTTPVKYIASWTDEYPFQPVFAYYPNSARVAEVCEDTFAVSAPLFWQACADNLIADRWYYDTATQSFIFIVVPEPPPRPPLGL